jgi:DUF2950 family protein
MKPAGSPIEVSAPAQPRRNSDCDRLTKVAGNIARKIVMSNIIVNRRAALAHSRQPLFIAALLSLCLLAGPRVWADGAAPQTFATPEAAVDALVAATEANNMDALRTILGAAAEPILSSGDPVADQNARANFAAKYHEMHRLAYDDQGRVILYLGADDWPMPIPLVKKDGAWMFDAASGQAELLYRRVGRNELYTIDVLKKLAQAQEDYADAAVDSEGTRQFARKFHSDPGSHDGLYWEVASGETESPIGPLVASATAEGYKRDTSGNPIPFHGYYYRILTRQGPHAPGGAKNYIVNGKMTRGFAFLAVPAEYRSSGVMTFMINQDGVIVQKDLGADTARIAAAITSYNPDHTWDQVVE